MQTLLPVYKEVLLVRKEVLPVRKELLSKKYDMIPPPPRYGHKACTYLGVLLHCWRMYPAVVHGCVFCEGHRLQLCQEKPPSPACSSSKDPGTLAAFLELWVWLWVLSCLGMPCAALATCNSPVGAGQIFAQGRTSAGFIIEITPMCFCKPVNGHTTDPFYACHRAIMEIAHLLLV